MPYNRAERILRVILDSSVKAPVFENMTLKCADCGDDFRWTVGEQKFYWTHQFQAPRRCPICRTSRNVVIARRKLLEESSPEFSVRGK